MLGQAVPAQAPAKPSPDLKFEVASLKPSPPNVASTGGERYEAGGVPLRLLQTEIGAANSFQFEKVQPGRYRVELNDVMDAYVKSLSLGSVQVDGDILDVRNGSGGGALTLTISADTGEISGIVSDSKGPVAGVMVMSMPGTRDPGIFPKERRPIPAAITRSTGYVRVSTD